ncbi:hypothetical protein HYPBUDRAFT_153679 [Hyphopichia burtonii NRRL Y-1933]|uniref:Uncharacterized protein n=1 Tax=Hyphopichia burtonii NRRL Y-1933 TaxID=984485 RepID=A0A1E4RG34_9ASCO|nr:hypothetical protein HYPBUDRAFT_153679 [Hyphopichia burtonii NRRL Y-1933]ODV66224.1 hypothetical protein HYPBUDRAFT_153679 [Hyphopichia burtonii NRRL Y-1933]
MDPKIRQLFKTLVYMGKDYPVDLGGYPKFIEMAKRGFRNTRVENDHDLTQALAKGNYIIKGMF